MEAEELARHDEALVAAATGERPIVVSPSVVASGDSAAGGRRADDFLGGVVTRIQEEAGNFLGIWKDERNHWSTRRILLWAWTGLGFWIMRREVMARVYVVGNTIIQPHPLNNAWIQAWQVTEGALIVAVFGPVMIDYFRNEAPSITAIGTALRDKVIEPVTVVTERRDKAASIGSDGTEYNE